SYTPTAVADGRAAYRAPRQLLRSVGGCLQQRAFTPPQAEQAQRGTEQHDQGAGAATVSARGDGLDAWSLGFCLWPGGVKRGHVDLTQRRAVAGLQRRTGVGPFLRRSHWPEPHNGITRGNAGPRFVIVGSLHDGWQFARG